MGGGQSICSEQQLRNYEECTYFNRKEIIRLYKKFSSLNPEKISSKTLDATTRLTMEEVANMPELRVNPFKHRICQVFSTDESGLHFPDFLDLCSVFSDRCPRKLKASYAFMIYDFNDDSVLCADDIKQILKCYSETLSDAELDDIAKRVLIETVGISTNAARITFRDFEQVLSRALDFGNLFRFSV